jgi:hypothetical protein
VQKENVWEEFEQACLVVLKKESASVDAGLYMVSV